MRAIILAAGLGTRLRPMTNNTPKALIKVKDKPLVEYQIEYLKEKGFLNTDEFGVSVMASFGYRDQEITPKVRWNKEAIYEVIE